MSTGGIKQVARLAVGLSEADARAQFDARRARNRLTEPVLRFAYDAQTGVAVGWVRLPLPDEHPERAAFLARRRSK